MIEKRSIVLTIVVLAMLFAGMLLYLFTSGGGLPQAKIAINPEEPQAMEATDAPEAEITAGVTDVSVVNEAKDEALDVSPTAATGVKGYVIMAAGLAVLMGLIGLITAWRKSSARQVEL
ncbi:MAG: hypothetical protein ABIH36_00220 [bacterium]